MTTFHARDEKMKIDCKDVICRAAAPSILPGAIAVKGEALQ